MSYFFFHAVREIANVFPVISQMEGEDDDRATMEGGTYDDGGLGTTLDGVGRIARRGDASGAGEGTITRGDGDLLGD